MAIEKLVQVGSTMWLDPNDIVGVRWIEEHKPLIQADTGKTLIEGSAGYTQILHRSNSLSGIYTGYLSSDWGIARVQAALGLTSAEQLEDMLGTE